MKLLENKWALVTGSSRGVGQQIALGLAQRQCNVIVHGRTKQNVAETLRLLKAYDVQTHVVVGELSSRKGIDAIINGVKAGPDRVDILYNNAAIQNEWKSIWKITPEEWQVIFQVNVFALVALCTPLRRA